LIKPAVRLAKKAAAINAGLLPLLHDSTASGTLPAPVMDALPAPPPGPPTAPPGQAATPRAVPFGPQALPRGHIDALILEGVADDLARLAIEQPAMLQV
jgi:hypothetical protein